MRGRPPIPPTKYEATQPETPDAGATTAGKAPPTESPAPLPRRRRLLVEVLELKFARPTVRRAVDRLVPGVAIATECRGVGRALLGEKAFERREPVAVVGLSGVGIARGLCALDLLGEGTAVITGR